ncbi:MAG: ATP-dependent nuclease subunit B [Streptococcaceae bacterium]|jgi:ATP-dependent helicase/nuclease subunit B|nr:ATP-dependent nuclease subunit B [Streptococcaceae bacterium]
MKIIHTNIYDDLTHFLIDEARQHLKKAKRIFYIVPSSLSFEKEREILKRFNSGQDVALFDLTVTRLKQLPWYFDKNQENNQNNLTNIGLAMLMRRTLKHLSDAQIPTYRFMRDKQGFITQIIELYQELNRSNLKTDELLLANNSKKNQELKLILDEFNDQLAHFLNEQKLSQFIDNVIDDRFTKELQDCILIVDGYSRMTAEEMTLIDVLNDKVSEIIFGVYASKKAVTATFIEGNIYQQSVELIEKLKQKYKANIIYKSINEVDTTFTELSTLMEKSSDFTLSDDEVLNHQDGLELWQVVNHKEEIEHVAKQIRHLLFQGVRYQDILVLLGDVTTDAILLPEVFKTYAIPFFYAQEKSMKDHPLIVLVESLLKIKTTHYQLNDILNLLKTELYTAPDLNLQDVYKFEYYSLQRNIKGRRQFNQKFEEVQAEKIRVSLIGNLSPLQKFLEAKPQKGVNWVKKFQEFLADGLVKERLETLYLQSETKGLFENSSEHLEVWKLLLTVLEEFTIVFGLEVLSVKEFLDIIESGIQNATYRLVPSNVDVVQVKSYELVEPHTADYVFAIGLTQSNFPRSKQNMSLLSDDERTSINEKLKENNQIQYIDEPAFINSKKNSFTALQLFNAANKKLVLSTPQIYANEQSDLSMFLQFLIERSVKPLIKGAVNLNETIEHIGNYDGLLSNFGQVERLLLSSTDYASKSFWISLFRIMAKQPNYQHVLSALETDKLQERQVDSVVMSSLYPLQLNASVSSFENFYNCEYQYFLKHTLNLKAFEKINLDARISGSYFHEVFEKLMRFDQTEQSTFETLVTKSLQEVDTKYLTYFTRDATSRYTWTKLQEIIKQTATMLQQTLDNGTILPLAFEQAFGFEQSGIKNYQVALQADKTLNLRGLIDRVDKIFDTIGAVDYKSGDKKFDLQDAYDGVSLQFLTYLDILRQNATKFKTSSSIWGALYLQLHNPTIALQSVNQIADIAGELKKLMKYNGFFNSDLASELNQNFEHLFNLGQFTHDGLPYKNNTNFYKESEITAMIAHNELLYQQAGQKILSGKININPIVVKHHAKGCQFCQFKSICGFEADLHLGSGRKIHLKSKDDIRNNLLTGGNHNESSH